MNRPKISITQYKSEILSTIAILVWNLGLLHTNVMHLVYRPAEGYLIFSRLSIPLALILTIASFVFVRGLHNINLTRLSIAPGWILLTSSTITAHPGFLVYFLAVPLCWPIVLFGPIAGLYETVKAWNTESRTTNIFLLFLIAAWIGWMSWYYVEVGYFVINPKFFP